MTVEETESSNGEYDAEYYEDEEESSDAGETNTEAFTMDQQSYLYHLYHLRDTLEIVTPNPLQFPAKRKPIFNTAFYLEL